MGIGLVRAPEGHDQPAPNEQTLRLATGVRRVGGVGLISLPLVSNALDLVLEGLLIHQEDQ
eukprot:2437559-Pyramimonas_sp.AAC.1